MGNTGDSQSFYLEEGVIQMVRRMPSGWGKVPYGWEMREKWLEIPFAVDEYLARVKKLTELMRTRQIDVLLIHGNKADRGAIRWLTNFEDYYGGDSIAVVVNDGSCAFVTNSVMHGEPMHSGIQQVWMKDVRCAPHPRTVDTADTVYDHLDDIVKEKGLEQATFGIAGEYGSALAAHVSDNCPQAVVKRVEDILPKAMTHKSMVEIQALRRACIAADNALVAAMAASKEGVNEFEVSAAANYELYKFGAEESSFPIAVSSGPWAGFKHTAPTSRVLGNGDFVFVDLGARVQGYCSDCSRACVVGGPDKEQRHFLEANVIIVDTVMKAARPGVAISELGQVAADTAKSLGVYEYLYFRGHGISTTTHVPPSFFMSNPVKLEENMVFAFEPMLVKYEYGTACVEDLYWVTKDGVERLNTSPERFWE